MATTKVIPDVLDLNEATSESGLKIPSGTEFNRPATDVAGMIRNNTNEASEGSASCEEYYNGAAWLSPRHAQRSGFPSATPYGECLPPLQKHRLC